MKRVFLLASLLVVVVSVLTAPKAFAYCEKYKACFNGTAISCSGTTCSSGINWIQCDSQRYSCPTNGPCNITITCPSPYQPFRLGCYSPTGQCSSSTTSVTCGTTINTCAQCQSGAINCQLIAEP